MVGCGVGSAPNGRVWKRVKSLGGGRGTPGLGATRDFSLSADRMLFSDDNPNSHRDNHHGASGGAHSWVETEEKHQPRPTNHSNF